MTATCPNGHVSSDDEFCDQCGLRIGGAVAAPEPERIDRDDDDEDTARSPAREPCPSCGRPHSPDDRFCEVCGYDLKSTAAWEVVVHADRDWFERYTSAEVDFPEHYEEWRVDLNAGQVRIGRARAGSDAPPPEIDLSGARADPGISRNHAMLERRDDGTYAVLDLQSTNGTAVGDDGALIEPGVAVVLGDGDCVHIGAWTALTIRRR